MEPTVSETRTKELFKQAMSELVEEKREFFYELVVEALEDVGMANAIVEGRNNEFVSESDILAILEG